MKKGTEYSLVYALGAFLYGLIEITWRGYTHWSMALTGGAALLALYMLDTRMQAKPLLLKCLAGAAIITALEFAVGIFVNRMMHWNVWDYSAQPLNLLGQICPLFSLIWYFLCIPGYFLCGLIRRKLHFQKAAVDY